jgi:hypothetical protein
MRLAISLNLEKQKMYTQIPVSSDGFILNYIDLLLQLCKPFTSNFSKYPTFLSKINCFYLMTNDYISKATDLEKLNYIDFNMEEFLEGNGSYAPMSEVTQEVLVADDGKSMSSPNFITECFFLAHLGINFVTKKME